MSERNGVNMKKNAHIIKEIEEGSIAEELELEPGDELISINGKEIIDVFDYHYLIKGEEILVMIKSRTGKSGS